VLSPPDVPLPATLAFDSAVSPITTVNATGSSVDAFVNAVQTGSVSGAVAAVLDAPAIVANGFLGGQATVFLPPFSLEGISSQTIVPVGATVSPLRPATIELFGSPLATVGTTSGGIVPGLLNYPPQTLAEAIGAPSIEIF
jgi:hypothetical protein